MRKKKLLLQKMNRSAKLFFRVPCIISWYVFIDNGYVS